MAEEMLADAGLDTGSDLSADTGGQDGAELSQGTDSTEEAGGAEGETQEPQPGEENKALVAGPLVKDGKWSNPAAKAEIEKLPKEIATQIRHALFQADKYAVALPGGLKELQQIRETVEQLGGENGIKEFTSELDGWRQFDEQYMAGDAKVLDFLLSDPAGTQAFLKVAPAAFDRFAQLDQGAFTHYVCNTVAGSMASSDIPLTIARLGDFIPADNPARALFDKIEGYVKWVTETGRNAPTPKDKAQDPGAQSEIDKRAQELDKREGDLRKQDWQKKTVDGRNGIFRAQIKEQLGNRQLSEAQSNAFKRIYGDELNSLVNAHMDKLNAYFSAKDEAGFIKYANQLSGKYVPIAIRKALEIVMPGAKPGPKAGGQQQRQVPGAVKPPVAGWDRVASYEAIKGDIDWNLTRQHGGSAAEGRVVLKSGKKVQYPIK